MHYAELLHSRSKSLLLNSEFIFTVSHPESPYPPARWETGVLMSNAFEIELDCVALLESASGYDLIEGQGADLFAVHYQDSVSRSRLLGHGYKERAISRNGKVWCNWARWGWWNWTCADHCRIEWEA